MANLSDIQIATLQIGLRHCIQDLPDLIRGCRWVIDYRSKRTDVHADYLACVRRYSELCERAEEMGIAGGKLTEALPPLPIWNDDYNWAGVLSRVASPAETTHARAA